MSLVMLLALGLSAYQVEEIIVEQFPNHDIQQVIPSSHITVEYEWRIEGWEYKAHRNTGNEVVEGSRSVLRVAFARRARAADKPAAASGSEARAAAGLTPENSSHR